MVAKKMLPMPGTKARIGTAVKFGNKLKAKNSVKNYIGQGVSEMAQINRGGNKSGVTKGKYLGAIKRRLAKPATPKMARPAGSDVAASKLQSQEKLQTQTKNELQAGYKNYGQQRSAQAHALNAARGSGTVSVAMPTPNKAAIKKKLQATRQ